MENKQQHEIIYDIDTMTENRKNVMNIFKDIQGKYFTGNFTLQNLVKDYNYSLVSANVIIDTLARNGLLKVKNSFNNTLIYGFEKDKKMQIENIQLWKKRSEQELQFFTLAIQVIEAEIFNEATKTNLKIVQ